MAIVNGWWDADYRTAKICAELRNLPLRIAQTKGAEVDPDKFATPEDFVTRFTWESDEPTVKPRQSDDELLHLFRSFAGMQ